MKIGQLSKKTNISTHTIRYYEKSGLLNKPKKDNSGHRFYDHTDVELVNWVLCLKKSDMPLRLIKEYVQIYRDEKNIRLIEMLEEHLKKLRLQHKNIEHYIDVTKQKLINLKKHLT